MLILGLKELNNVALLVNVHVPEEKTQTQKSALVRGVGKGSRLLVL